MGKFILRVQENLDFAPMLRASPSAQIMRKNLFIKVFSMHAHDPGDTPDLVGRRCADALHKKRTKVQMHAHAIELNMKE